MRLNTSIFEGGSVDVDTDNWADGIFEAMAVCLCADWSNFRQPNYHCAPATLTNIVDTLTGSGELLMQNTGAVAGLLAAIDTVNQPKDDIQAVGHLLKGLSTLAVAMSSQARDAQYAYSLLYEATPEETAPVSDEDRFAEGRDLATALLMESSRMRLGVEGSPAIDPELRDGKAQNSFTLRYLRKIIAKPELAEGFAAVLSDRLGIEKAKIEPQAYQAFGLKHSQGAHCKQAEEDSDNMLEGASALLGMLRGIEALQPLRVEPDDRIEGDDGLRHDYEAADRIVGQALERHGHNAGFRRALANFVLGLFDGTGEPNLSNWTAEGTLTDSGYRPSSDHATLASKPAANAHPDQDIWEGIHGFDRMVAEVRSQISPADQSLSDQDEICFVEFKLMEAMRDLLGIAEPTSEWSNHRCGFFLGLAAALRSYLQGSGAGDGPYQAGPELVEARIVGPLPATKPAKKPARAMGGARTTAKSRSGKKRPRPAQSTVTKRKAAEAAHA